MTANMVFKKLRSGLACVVLGIAVSAAMIGPAWSSDMDDAPRTPFTWTGFTAGLQAGAGWSTAYWEFNAIPSTNDPDAIDMTGAVFGAHVGAHFQVGTMAVLGAEATLDFASLDGNNSCQAGAAICKVETTHLITTLVRIGVPLGKYNQFHAYGTVGYTGMGVETKLATATTVWHHGWAAGGGADFRLNKNVSLGAQYLYSEFFEANHVPGQSRDLSLTLHTVKARASYHF